MELLTGRTGQNVIKFPLCPEEEKLAILIGEVEVRKLLQNSNVIKDVTPRCLKALMCQPL